jgi:RNA polymerase sigma factor for flagellar operon FliA
MEAQQEQKLWKEARQASNTAAHLTLIDHYTHLAKIIAAHYYRIRPDNDIEYDDYLQHAMVGLIEAVHRYDPDRGVSFSTYANYRIKGALLNGLEKTTEQRQQSAYLRKCQRARVKSIAKDLDQSADDSFTRMVEVTVELALSFMLEDSGMLHREKQDNIELYEQDEMKPLAIDLTSLVDRLPERERLIIRYHYYHGVAFEELARLLDISKGRVSQLHKRALQLIKTEYENTQGLDIHY